MKWLIRICQTQDLVVVNVAHLKVMEVLWMAPRHLLEHQIHQLRTVFGSLEICPEVEVVQLLRSIYLKFLNIKALLETSRHG